MAGETRRYRRPPGRPDEHSFALRLAMPKVGIEPTLPGGNRILSPARLPVPPLRLALHGTAPIRRSPGTAPIENAAGGRDTRPFVPPVLSAELESGWRREREQEGCPFG